MAPIEALKQISWRQMPFNDIGDTCKGNFHEERRQKTSLLQNCPNYFAAVSRSSNCGIWWCFCASDDSDACCVPTNLACNLCHMSSRLPLNVPVCLYCQRWRKKKITKASGQRAGRADFEKVLFSNIDNVFLWCVFFSCIYLCKAGLHRWNLKACCPFHLRDKQEESCGGAGNKPPTPSPSGHGAFYIPPSISITITVTRPRARRDVDDPVERMYAPRLSEEPAAAAEEADRRRYERSSQSSAAEQKRGWRMKWRPVHSQGAEMSWSGVKRRVLA